MLFSLRPISSVDVARIAANGDWDEPVPDDDELHVIVHGRFLP